jgi:hypothetical protein
MKELIAAGVLMAAMLGMIAGWSVAPQPVFNLTATEAGNVYILDHGLTASDCMAVVTPATACELAK